MLAEARAVDGATQAVTGEQDVDATLARRTSFTHDWDDSSQVDWVKGAGIDLARPIVTTCGSGITAAVLAFGAHLLGNEAALYDGSWSEWGGDPSTPKAMGAKATGTQ